MSKPATQPDPAPKLDPLIHPINRLKICAALLASGAVEGPTRREMKFASLQNITGLSAPTLSKQLTALEEHGYVTRFREYGSSRDKDVVWVMLTRGGRSAYDGHIAALQDIAGQ